LKIYNDEKQIFIQLQKIRSGLAASRLLQNKELLKSRLQEQIQAFKARVVTMLHSVPNKAICQLGWVCLCKLQQVWLFGSHTLSQTSQGIILLSRRTQLKQMHQPKIDINKSSANMNLRITCVSLKGNLNLQTRQVDMAFFIVKNI